MDTATQIRAAHTSALALSSARETLVVSGNDRLTWLNGLVTCDLAKREAGGAAYGLVVGRHGRVLADLFVVVDEGRLLLSVPPETLGTLKQHFEHYLVMEDAEMLSGSEAFEEWVIHGPRARDLLGLLRGVGGVGGELDRTGLGGAIVFVPRERGAQVRELLASGVIDLRGAVGDGAGWEALRLERSVPEFGADFDATTYPQEGALEKAAVSFSKGCYLGQEVVCMLELRGHVKRKLASLVIDASAVPSRRATVTDVAGAAVGEVTSSALSPTLGRPVALAMIKRSHTERGSQVLVEGAPAEVVERPA